MKILMIYAKDEYTTANYIYEAFERGKEHQIRSAGINKDGLVNRTKIEVPRDFLISDLLSGMEKPDLILVMQGFANMRIRGIENIKNCITAYYGIDTHTENKLHIFEEAKNYQFVFLAQQKGVREFIDTYKRENVFWLPCAAEPLVHKPLNFDVEYDFAFVGGLDKKFGHDRRNKLLGMLDKKYKVLPANAYGYFLSEVYSKSKIVFNCSFNQDINMRMFEGMACKRLVFTDQLEKESGIDLLFTPGEDYIPYTDDNIMELADKYLKDDKQRDKIAESGYNKVLKSHTYDNRVKDMICQIKEKTTKNP